MPHFIATKMPVKNPRNEKRITSKYKNLFFLKFARKVYLIFESLHKVAYDFIYDIFYSCFFDIILEKLNLKLKSF